MSFFTDLDEAIREHKKNLEWNPLLQAIINPFVETEFEQGKAIGMQFALFARFGSGFGARTRYTFTRKTHRNAYESRKHFDNEMIIRGRLYVYRHHQLDHILEDEVFGDEELLATYGYDKEHLARLQSTCQAWAMNAALQVVLRSVERGGGFTRWLLSHDLHRKRFWSDAYDSMAFFVDRDFFHWQAQAVNFDAIHGITDDATRTWRQKNKIVVLELLEATWQYVVSRSPRFDYAVRRVWRKLPNHPEILSLNLPTDPLKVPSNPGGVLGMVRRQEAVLPYGGGGDPMVIDHFPMYSGF
ncbi:hypothetical protein KC331_g9627 [Hortaea werneckii]|nr:hypothetical protein KC331_g9627 [Hortaea werneckii]KAI7710045.1 hypothetical protein KC353_g9951 [Hortaea werneckii]